MHEAKETVNTLRRLHQASSTSHAVPSTQLHHLCATEVSFDPATTYCFSVFNLLNALSGSFSVSATICFGVEPIHWPSAISIRSSAQRPKSNGKTTTARTSKRIRLQHLQKHQLLIPRILDIMAARLREIPHITSAIIKRRGGTRRLEQGRPPLAADEKGPLVATGMPVDLAHAAGLHGDDGGGEVRGDGEGGRVDDLDGAAGDLVGRLLGEVVGVAVFEGDDAGGGGDVLLLDVLGGWGAGEDVEFVVWDVFEGADREA